jgi:hypothetical protein
MAPPKGNEYWKRVKNWKHGADVKYTPEALWNVAVEYFDFFNENPLQEEKVFGTGVKMEINKMRAMTLTSFCVFAQISKRTFDGYCGKEEYMPVTERIRSIIYSQKLEGSAAGLLEYNIIARELGLIDKLDLTSEGKHLFEINVIDDQTKKELEKIRMGI